MAHGKRYRQAYEKVDRTAAYPPGEAVQLLKQTGLIRTTRQDVKILGNGELTTKLTVVAHAVSAGARKKIEAAGGSVTLLREPKVKPDKPKSKAKPAAQESEPQAEPSQEAEDQD